MTEDEWRVGHRPEGMLDWLERTLGVTQRKKRLFVCAACRLVWQQLRPEVRRLVEAAEEFTDRPGAAERIDPVSRGRFHDALLSLSRVTLTPVENTVVNLAGYTFHGVGRGTACLGTVADLGSALPREALAELLRELFGNPFRKARWVGASLRGRIDTWPSDQQPADLLLVREWLMWNGGLIGGMAEDIYEHHDWDRLPILADALEEAGCCESALLGHLRQTKAHARGCWVLDHLLEKECGQRAGVGAVFP